MYSCSRWRHRAIQPLFLCFYFKAHAPGGFWFFEPRETACIFVIWLWALRFFILVPWEGWTQGLHSEDWRYVHVRKQLPNAILYWMMSFTSLHLTPTLLVYGALCPVARVILLGSDAPAINAGDVLSVGASVLAIVVEGVADEQLRRFRASDGHSGLSCRVGLWRFSRHPNYFGECAFWASVGLGMAASAGVLRKEPILGVGAVAMFGFFRFASVPLMDERSLERRRDYGEVMATTSALVPWPTPRQPPAKRE